MSGSPASVRFAPEVCEPLYAVARQEADALVVVMIGSLSQASGYLSAHDELQGTSGYRPMKVLPVSWEIPGVGRPPAAP